MIVQLREPKTVEELQLYYDLRWRILREPSNAAKETVQDENEQNAFHLLAWNDGKPVGAGRLHFNSPKEAQVRYMAVEEGFARSGIGSLILQTLEDEARRRGARRLVLNARESAVPFYRKHNYVFVDSASRRFGSLVRWRMHKGL